MFGFRWPRPKKLKAMPKPSPLPNLLVPGKNVVQLTDRGNRTQKRLRDTYSPQSDSMEESTQVKFGAAIANYLFNSRKSKKGE